MFSTASSATGAGWSTSPAETKPGTDPGARPPAPFQLTRRALLASTAALPVVATVPAFATDEPQPIDRGEPFDDGTYFDDGYGWVD